MSTLEMIIWGVLYALISITVAGIGFMLLGNQATCAESERLLAEADEDHAASEWF